MLRPPLRAKATTTGGTKQGAAEAIAQHAHLIGQRVHLEVDDGALQVECTVTDLKQVFGRTCAQVAPSAGAGSTWVNLPRITPIAKEPAQ